MDILYSHPLEKELQNIYKKSTEISDFLRVRKGFNTSTNWRENKSFHVNFFKKDITHADLLFGSIG